MSETWRGKGKGKETIGGSTGFPRDRARLEGHCLRPYLSWTSRAVGAGESRGHAILRTGRRNERNGTSSVDLWLELRVHGGEGDDGLDRQRLWGWIREREIT